MDQNIENLDHTNCCCVAVELVAVAELRVVVLVKEELWAPVLPVEVEGSSLTNSGVVLEPLGTNPKLSFPLLAATQASAKVSIALWKSMTSTC